MKDNDIDPIMGRQRIHQRYGTRAWYAWRGLQLVDGVIHDWISQVRTTTSAIEMTLLTYTSVVCKSLPIWCFQGYGLPYTFQWWRLPGVSWHLVWHASLLCRWHISCAFSWVLLKLAFIPESFSLLVLGIHAENSGKGTPGLQCVDHWVVPWPD